MSEANHKTPAHPTSLNYWLPWIPIGVIWALLFRQVSWEWDIIPQYNYGYAVPFLAAYLGWKRWETAPAVDRYSPSKGLIWTLGISAVLLLALFAPARLVQEANRDWRLLYWIQGGIACGLTWTLIAGMGGKRWIAHFTFPILFALLAIPWPTLAEELWIQGLRDSVTHFAVEILNWTGVPAFQRGTVIELGNGLVGVDEACSGIQSFQASLMVSFFLGELFELKWRWRIPVIGFSLLWAYLLNVVRAYTLARIARVSGPQGVEEWHDFTGLTLMGICFGGIILLALWLDLKTSKPVLTKSAKPASKLPEWVSIVSAIWVALIAVGVEGWYRVHENRASEGKSLPQWTVQWPAPDTVLQRVDDDFADSVRTILRYNEAEKTYWKESDQTSWLGYYFEWERGNAAVMNTQYHTPQGCMTFSGVEVQSSHPSFEVEVDKVSFKISAFTAKDDRREFHVFYLLWKDPPGLDNSSNEGTDHDWSARKRLRNALHGKRNYAQQTLQVAVFDAPDYEYAKRKFEDRLKMLISIH